MTTSSTPTGDPKFSCRRQHMYPELRTTTRGKTFLKIPGGRGRCSAFAFTRSTVVGSPSALCWCSPDVRAPGLEELEPIDCVPSREDRIRLLENFNFNWRDGKYRDVLPAEEKYSEDQTLYFSTPPAERMKLLELWGHLPPSPPC
ncbi:unnamed protein product [Staurois parvus]|uniref:Cyanocobalamin reductase / alkylcobalamin dealkylase n=1 Tax=Staurois parvus TaxID=386267 RepID=A0ABN9FSS0_9NEOB|nr:unnamed protein product [Staurois parvus]